MASTPTPTMEEEDNLALVVGEELSANNSDKQALGLQHVVALADAQKEVSVFFPLICECGLSSPVTDTKGGISSAFRQQTYQAIRATRAPPTHEKWSLVVDAVEKDLCARDWQLRIAAIKTLTCIPSALLAKRIAAATLDFQSNLTHPESPVRQTMISTLAELILYHTPLRKIAINERTFEEEAWGLIAQRIFDDNHYVVSTAFSALGVILREAAGITRKLDYEANTLIKLVRIIAEIAVPKLRILFSLFTDLSDDLARPVVFPLVYLVSLLSVESEVKLLPAVKGATGPNLVIEECVEDYLLPLLGASSPTLIYEVGIAINFLSRYHAFAPSTWLLSVLTEYVNLLTCQLTPAGLYNLVRDIVPLLHLLPWEQIFETIRKLLLSIKLIAETHKRFELMCLIAKSILFFDVNRITKDDSLTASLLIRNIGTDAKLTELIWNTTNPIREEILACLASLCFGYLTRSQETGKVSDVEPWFEESLSLATVFSHAIVWETGERRFSVNSFLALVHQLALLVPTLASTDQKKRFNELLTSTFFTKLLAIKDETLCLKVVYMLCAHMRGWLLTKEMVMGIVAVIKRRFLNLDAVDARTHTLRVAARAGKFGTGNRQVVPTPTMLETPLACLMLLAVKCPEIKTLVCEEILRRLMFVHANDALLCERCEMYLERINFLSTRYKESREDEERRDKERDRERTKRRNGATCPRNTENGRRTERTSRPKKEKKEKKGSSDKKDKGETLKKGKKTERTMRKKKKEEKQKDKPDGVLASKDAAVRSPAERLEDMSPFLDFSAFVPAESTAPFDPSAPDDEFYVAFKMFGDLTSSPSTLTNSPDAFLHYFVARERDVTTSEPPSPLPSTSTSPSISKPQVLLSGPSDPFAIHASHDVYPELNRITLRVEIVNVTRSAIENVNLTLSAAGHVVSAHANGVNHKLLSKVEAGERTHWEVDFTVKSFSRIEFYLQVQVPYEKDPVYVIIQGGRGGIGGGLGSGDGANNLYYRTLSCSPYTVPAHKLLLRRPYTEQEFHALWNRFAGSWRAEVRFGTWLDFNAIASALSSTNFVPVIQSINPETLHMSLCGCSWFGEQLFFTLSATSGERGAVEASIECRASSPVVLRSFVDLIESGWLGTLFGQSLITTSSSHRHRTAAVEFIRRGQRSAYTHFLSQSASTSASQAPSIIVSSSFNSTSFTPINTIPTSNGVPSSSLPASASTSVPPPQQVAMSLSSYGSGALDLDSSSSYIPYTVLLHSRVGSSSKAILTRWLDAYRT